MSTLFNQPEAGDEAVVEDLNQYAGPVNNLEKGATWWGETGGSNNAYTVTLTPAPGTLSAGKPVVIKASFTNTGSATLAVNGGSAIAITKNGSSLTAGDITSGVVYILIYDGSSFQLISSGESGGSVSLPLTSKGDLLTHTGIELARLPVGANGKILTANSIESAYGVQWQYPATYGGKVTELTLGTGSLQSLVKWENPYDATKTNVISWSTEDIDECSMFSGTQPTKLTCTETGWYHIEALLAVVVNGWSQAAILLNSDNFSGSNAILQGVTDVNGYISGSMTKMHRINIPAVYLTSGDVLRLVVICENSGSTSNITVSKLWAKRSAAYLVDYGFRGLTDTPDSYDEMATKAVAVNSAGTGLTFVDFPSGGGSGWSSSNLTALTRNAMQSLLSWQEPYDATRTNVIKWDTENLDNLGVWYSGSPGLITIQATGWYRIDVHLPTVMNSWSRASILKNTDAWSAEGFLENVVHAIPNGDGSMPRVHLLHHPAVYLTAGDVLRVTVIGTAGGNTGLDSEYCKFWIQKLA